MVYWGVVYLSQQANRLSRCEGLLLAMHGAMLQRMTSDETSDRGPPFPPSESIDIPLAPGFTGILCEFDCPLIPRSKSSGQMLPT